MKFCLIFLLAVVHSSRQENLKPAGDTIQTTEWPTPEAQTDPVASVTSAASTDDRWTRFKARTSKKYSNKFEESERRGAFLQNLKMIEEANAGNASYTLAVNEFSDLNFTEFVRLKCGVRPPPESEIATWGKSATRQKRFIASATPASLSYYQTSYVSAVKNQGSCGSCWSFTSSQAVEAQSYRTLGIMISPSEQQLIDCSTANYGCNGGWMDKGFKYMANGVASEASYKYYGYQRSCKYTSSKYAAIFVSGYSTITDKDESALMDALYWYGPIAVYFCSTSRFQSYSSGIYTYSSCDNGEINHAVMVVGYGTKSGTNYWLVKNSWGTKWGVVGYAYVARGQGLIRLPLYPTGLHDPSTTVYSLSGSSRLEPSSSLFLTILLPFLLHFFY